jgi:hypothetical protein
LLIVLSWFSVKWKIGASPLASRSNGEFRDLSFGFSVLASELELQEDLSRINFPGLCPNCDNAQTLGPHGYYWRWVTEALCGEVLRMAVRLFFGGPPLYEVPLVNAGRTQSRQ